MLPLVSYLPIIPLGNTIPRNRLVLGDGVQHQKQTSALSRLLLGRPDWRPVASCPCDCRRQLARQAKLINGQLDCTAYTRTPTASIPGADGTRTASQTPRFTTQRYTLRYRSSTGAQRSIRDGHRYRTGTGSAESGGENEHCVRHPLQHAARYYEAVVHVKSYPPFTICNIKNAAMPVLRIYE